MDDTIPDGGLISTWDLTIATATVVTGAGPGGGPHVRTFGPGGPVGDVLPYVAGFTGGVHVAACSRFTTEQLMVVTGPGPGGGPHIRGFDGSTGLPHTTNRIDRMAYDPAFTGGVFMACGSVSGNGTADVVVGAGAGGGPHVRVFSGADGAELFGFMAYDLAFTGGVFVACGDVNGDGRPDIVTGPGPGGGPHVRIFSGADGSEIESFFAYDPAFTGGVFVGYSRLLP